MNALLGMLTFSLGGLAGATFLLPARGVKGWAYETWWLFYCLVGHIVCPTLICWIAVPDFWNVVQSAPGTAIAQCVFFGAIWGVGGLTWGLMVRYLGIGLGLAIGCGLCAATGTLIPPIAQGHAADHQSPREPPDAPDGAEEDAMRNRRPRRGPDDVP